jgi:hypothetical protein
MKGEKSRCIHSLMTILLLFQTARSFRNGAGFYTSLGGQMRVFDFNKKTLDAKSSGGSKDYNLSDGGNCSHWISSLLLFEEDLDFNYLNELTCEKKIFSQI